MLTMSNMGQPSRKATGAAVRTSPPWVRKLEGAGAAMRSWERLQRAVPKAYRRNKARFKSLTRLEWSSHILAIETPSPRGPRHPLHTCTRSNAGRGFLSGAAATAVASLPAPEMFSPTLWWNLGSEMKLRSMQQGSISLGSCRRHPIEHRA